MFDELQIGLPGSKIELLEDQMLDEFGRSSISDPLQPNSAKY